MSSPVPIWMEEIIAIRKREPFTDVCVVKIEHVEDAIERIATLERENVRLEAWQRRSLRWIKLDEHGAWSIPEIIDIARLGNMVCKLETRLGNARKKTKSLHRANKELREEVEELSEDKARLDWLAEERDAVFDMDATGNPYWEIEGDEFHTSNLRDAIDAARHAATDEKSGEVDGG